MPARRSWISNLLPKFRPAAQDATISAADTRESASTEPDAANSEEEGRLSNVGDFNPLPADQAETHTSDSQIFSEIGATLRKRRTMLSLTYEEVERHIRVRTTFLKALEDGALDNLPSPVQTRGILANYAGFLDLEVDAILLRFADGLQARHQEQRRQAPARGRAPMAVHTSLPPLRSFIASDLLFGGGTAIMLVLFAVWGISRIMSVRSALPARATAPSISDVLAGTALPTLEQQVTLIPAEATSQVSEPTSAAIGELPTFAANANVQLTITATTRTYMRITVDGQVQFEGRAEPNTDYPYQADRQIEILSGNGAALKITYNGRDLGLMGRFGEVVDRIYTAQGVLTPTATLAPTRTPTPFMTGTPSETPTPTPSVTLTPKPGG